jgi:hypothetical protein
MCGTLAKAVKRTHADRSKEEAIVSEPFIAEMIIVKAVSDRTFLKGLATEPERTLKEAGFEVTREQLSVIDLAKPEEWGDLTAEDIRIRIDTLAKKR